MGDYSEQVRIPYANFTATPLTAPVGITMGDPSGVGPEVIAKLFGEAGLSSAAVVIGD